MYKCVDCGHIFDDGEEAIREEKHPYGDTTASEYFSECPVCGGDFETTHDCKKCGGAFLWDELIGGYYCEDCLKEALTVENFLGFAEYADKHLGESELHTVEHFMLVWIYGVSDNDIKGSSKDFRTLMIAEFKNAVDAHNRAAKYGADDKFLEQIWQYMEDYKLLPDFAEYLYDKEVRK
jgi:hypothetical protein